MRIEVWGEAPVQPKRDEANCLMPLFLESIEVLIGNIFSLCTQLLYSLSMSHIDQNEILIR